MSDHPMCPTCRRADVEVRMARDVREPCPHCATGRLLEWIDQVGQEHGLPEWATTPDTRVRRSA